MESQTKAPAVALQKTAIQPSLLIKPVATNEEIVIAWQNYQELKAALLKQDDYQVIQGKKCIKKSGWRKIQTAFGISDELVKEERKDYGRYFVFEVTVKATAQNGRSALGVGSCASNERKFAHLEHDTRSTAHTRAKNRATSDLVGGGEVSAEEMTSSLSGKQENNNEPEEIIDQEHIDNMFQEEYNEPERTAEPVDEDFITEKQKSLLISLLYQKIADTEERSQKLDQVDSMSKSDASEIIGELLNQ